MYVMVHNAELIEATVVNDIEGSFSPSFSENIKPLIDRSVSIAVNAIHRRAVST